MGLFSPFAAYYSQQIDQFLSEYQGLVNISKRHFWKFFHEAWERAFTAKNIRSAWEAAGICPLNPDRILAKIKKRNNTPGPVSTLSAETLRSTRALRRTYAALTC